MKQNVFKALAVSLAIGLLPSTAFAEAMKFRITTENNVNHVNTKFLQEFTDRVNSASAGEIEVELFHSGQLYKGKDVPRALRQGSVEMAAVGTWQLGGVAPDINLLFIPHFYGRANNELNALVDGNIGNQLNKGLEASLESVVLGRWMGFGAGNTFGAGRSITSFDDLKGAKIRIPGGLANTARFKALGAVPTVLPWPDTPLALQQGTVDGLLTTFESAASAKLYESGVKTAFEDNQYFGFFVPLVSNTFWHKAPDSVKELLNSTWADMIDDGRASAADAQLEARQTLIDNGVVITVPDAADVAATRAEMIANEPALVGELGSSMALYEAILAELP
jgi:TRAP-type C4-dicarboxylate transport system substrate-binding protein